MSSLPSYASVVVVGGGVMGCSTLYHLAKNGIGDAVLLERNQLTSGTTWHSAAQVRALRSTKNLTDLIRYSVHLYSQLEKETGQHTGWINKGSLSIATNEDRLTHILRQEALAHLFGVRAQTINPKEAKEHWPLMNTEDVIGAVWSPDDGRVSPSDLCAALIKGARSRGAKVFENTSIVGITTKDNKIIGVETSGGFVRCDAIALCTGLWSREIASMAGVEAPIWPCEHFYLLTKPIDGLVGNLPTLSDHDGHLYIRDDSGGLLVGCFEPMGKPISPQLLGKDFAFQLLPEDWEHFEPMMVNALHRLPALEVAEVRMLLNGPESFTPDGSFLLGEAAETRGLFLGCGMNSVGVATGGGAGMALAHCIQHGHPPSDLLEVDPKRFSPIFNSVQALTQRAPEVLGKHYEITYPGRQWTSARNLRKTPLHARWEAENACFDQFYHWERPLYFNKLEPSYLTFSKPPWTEIVEKEVLCATNHAAVFDQSTFGKIEVTGIDACQFLNRLCTNQIDKPLGSVIYTSMLNTSGGVESDLTVLRINEEQFRLYVGTTSIKKDFSWLSKHLDFNEDVKLKDCSEDYAVLGLMGPKSGEIATAIGAGEINNLKYFQSSQAKIRNHLVRAARLSYVGEPGWEITCENRNVLEIYDALKDCGAQPAGFYAQSSMRIEKRFLAYGHELDTDISPLEAGLDFTIDWSKEFIGKSALIIKKRRGVSNRLVSVLFQDPSAVPLGNEPVLFDGKIVGKTTSAAFGFRVGAPIAIANIAAERARIEGTQISVNIAGNLFLGTVSVVALHDPSGTRLRKKTL
ncbi:MAG: FAD-dependent oxidoreductase [Rhodospirillaceae bacterium]|nr:FAD-dependent oxidoreductase [Rhodospirillaceae bacterium]